MPRSPTGVPKPVCALSSSRAEELRKRLNISLVPIQGEEVLTARGLQAEIESADGSVQDLQHVRPAEGKNERADVRRRKPRHGT